MLNTLNQLPANQPHTGRQFPKPAGRLVDQELVRHTIQRFKGSVGGFAGWL
jgi:hypothetical protein